MDQSDLNERFQRRIKGTFTEFLGMRLLEVGQGHVVGERSRIMFLPPFSASAS